jgi:hypothetical protein
MRMRVLVAGRSAKAVATAAGAFANDLTIETAATKAACIALLERTEFDLIVACETLGDGSGLEVLSHAAVNTPDTLRIFAARPSTLNLLQGELGLFGLFRTLPYPISFRKLWAALNLARSCHVETEPRTQAPSPSVQHVVLESEWQTGEQTGAVRERVTPQAQQPAAGTPARRTANAALATAVRNGAAASAAGGAAAVRRATNAPVHTRQAQPRQVPASHGTPAPRGPAAGSRRDRRIPESEAFKRALARRNAAKLEANTHVSAVEVLGAVQRPGQAGDRDERQREPAMSNDSLAQLARLTTTHRPKYDALGVPGGKRRTALFVGSGVFAAATAAVLTFFMLNANNTLGSSLPLVASIERPIPQKVFPWQPAPQQPTSTVPVPSETAAPSAADLEVQAEAESDASAIEPGHPGPPQPNPPPGPSEPPSADSPGWVDE